MRLPLQDDPSEMPGPVLVLLNGRDFDHDLMGSWIGAARTVVTADGAAGIARLYGREPDWVVGDFDSHEFSADSPPHHIQRQNQDFSDAEKALDFVEESGIGHVRIAGIEGDRPDHVLMIMHAVLRSRLRVELLYRTGRGYIVRAGETLKWKGPVGTTLSSFPLNGTVRISKGGVQWPLANATMTLGEFVSLSNQSSDDVEFSVTEGAAWIFFNSHDGEVAW